MKNKELLTNDSKGFTPIAVSMLVITGIILAFQKIYFRE
jgi:hypothetical protein